MKKYFIVIAILFFIINHSSLLFAQNNKGNAVHFTLEEKEWIKNHKNKRFMLAVSSTSKTANFKNYGKQCGYLNDVLNLVNGNLGLKIQAKHFNEWNEAYRNFKQNKTDLIYGANPTTDRLKFMCFTRPISEEGYVVYTQNKFNVNTIADINGFHIGFLTDDFIVEKFRQEYFNLIYKKTIYDSYNGLVRALENSEIDAIIMPNGGHSIDGLLNKKNIKASISLDKPTSELTFAAHKEDEILIGIINKVLVKNKNEINGYIEKAKVNYAYKVLEFTEDEIEYLSGSPVITVGYYTGLKPWFSDDPSDNLGFIPAVLDEIRSIVDIEIKYVDASVKEIIMKAKKNEIDVLFATRTPQREKQFLFTEPITNEIDTIYGKNHTVNVRNLYGLEGKTVSVIDGAWHSDLLLENLKDVNIVPSNSANLTIECVVKNRAEYFIAPPMVAQYYLMELGYNNISEKGLTVTESKKALAITGNNKLLQSIFNKVLKYVDISKVRSSSISKLPTMGRNRERIMFKSIIYLVLSLAVIAFVLYWLILLLKKSKNEKKALENKNYLINIDALTNLKNRHYLKENVPRYENVQHLALIMIDLNDFKAINDTYGHDFGDIYLIKFSEILRGFFRESDIIRYGGDEFLLIINTNDEKLIVKRIEMLKKELCDVVVSHNGDQKHGIDFSAGYAIKDYNGTDVNISKLITIADGKMYIDKKRYKEI